MLPDRVSNPGPLTYESGALPIALRGPAINVDPVMFQLPYLFGYKTGLSLSRMSTNNQISPMQFCCYTGFTLPKQSQKI